MLALKYLNLCFLNFLLISDLACAVLGRSLRPHTLQPTGLLCPWGFSGQEYWSGLSCPPPGDLPHPGIEPRSPALQAASLPAEPPGKPKNIGVGSLTLLQQIFPTQELNQGLLHCREILYQLRHQGSPDCNYTYHESWLATIIKVILTFFFHLLKDLIC